MVGYKKFVADPRRCDRCGKSFDKNSMSLAGCSVICSDGNFRYLDNVCGMTGRSKVKFDLCSECVSDLGKWFVKGVPKYATNKV